MNNKEIDRLLCEISEGDNEAFVTLYEETKRGVYSFLWSYFGCREDAEDAMQTTYLKVKSNVCKYRPGSNGGAWLLQIAKNVALNTLKERKRNAGEIPETMPGAIDVDSDYAEKDSVMTLMQKALGAEERKIVMLHVVCGYKHKEIARMLGCPTGTVTSAYKRALDKMKKARKEEWV